MNYYNPKDYLSKLDEKDGYLELTVDTTHELMNLIRPENKERLLHIFQEYYSSLIEINGELKLNFNKLLFRGVANSSFTLTPTLYRNIDAGNYGGMRGNYSELMLLRNFIKACDLSATQIPNDSLKFRNLIFDDKLFNSALYSDDKNWFIEDFYELTAFAQHYGVPTRLLDWSYHPLVSLYFASIGAIKNVNESDESIYKKEGFFSLWVYSPIEHVNRDNQDFYNSEIKIIDVPKSINQHISFQQGCFIMVVQENNHGGLDFLLNEDSSIFDKSKNSYIKLNDKLQKLKLDKNLLKINIPFKCAIEVYEYCQSYNFHSATLFRGPHGGSQHVIETMLVGKQKGEKYFGVSKGA